MKILKLLWQSRRDFKAIFICEHCRHEDQRNGYDDSYFHEKVIPQMTCGNCGKKAETSYQPQQTKYPDGMLV